MGWQNLEADVAELFVDGTPSLLDVWLQGWRGFKVGRPARRHGKCLRCDAFVPRHRRVTCSKECSKKYRLRKVQPEPKCPCGVPVVARVMGRPRKYCSDKCRWKAGRR